MKKLKIITKLIFYKINLVESISFNYSRSLRFGFLDGSLERKPKINKETKKITVV